MAVRYCVGDESVKMSMWLCAGDIVVSISEAGDALT